MVTEKTLKSLNDLAVKTAARLRLVGVTPVTNAFDDKCLVAIPSDMANSRPEAADEFVKTIATMRCVADVEDESWGVEIPEGEYRMVLVYVTDGNYTVSAEDDAERNAFIASLPVGSLERAQAVKEAEAIVRRNSSSRLIPIPPCPRSFSDEAYLVLAYEFYDLIERGEKVTEFRRYTPNYVKKLLSHPVRTVRLQRGYTPGKDGTVPQMVFAVRDIELYESSTRRSCPPDAVPQGLVPDFIAINLGKKIR